MHRYLALLFSVIAIAWLANTALAGGALIIKGGTFTIRRIHGDPIPVVKIYTDQNNPGLIFYEQENGKEGFVNTSNIANPGELLGLLKSDGSEESTEKYMAVGRERDRLNAEHKAAEEKLKEEKLNALAQAEKQKNTPITSKQSVTEKCSREWGTDYRMVEYCIKKQNEAIRNLSGQSGAILEKCRNEWGDDYRMVEYCTKKQTEAKRRLGF